MQKRRNIRPHYDDPSTNLVTKRTNLKSFLILFLGDKIVLDT